jgi:hypothetical protein
MLNYWLALANVVLENEFLLLADNQITRSWYMKMPTTIPAICPEFEILSAKHHFAPQVGVVHHMRLTRLGIEAIGPWLPLIQILFQWAHGTLMV